MNDTPSQRSDATDRAASTYAVLQLSGCSGCEVSLLNADVWTRLQGLVYMPLVLSAADLPPVDTLLVSGAVSSEDDLHRLQQAAPRARRVVAVGTCAISGGVANLATERSTGLSTMWPGDAAAALIAPCGRCGAGRSHLPGCSRRGCSRPRWAGEPLQPAKPSPDCGT